LLDLEENWIRVAAVASEMIVGAAEACLPNGWRERFFP
jgi:hypothetical protein